VKVESKMIVGDAISGSKLHQNHAGTNAAAVKAAHSRRAV